jgi:hypothetical protein
MKLIFGNTTITSGILFPFLSQCIVGAGEPPASHCNMWVEVSCATISFCGTSLNLKYGERIDLRDFPDFSTFSLFHYQKNTKFIEK